MNGFYITLPSHSSTNEFPNNTANSFKIRLPHPIRLEGGGWKVGLVAVSLPDPCNELPNIMKNENNYLFQAHWLATDRTASSDPHRGYYAIFQVRDLTKVNNLDALDGTTLMNDIKPFSIRRKWRNLFEKDGSWPMPMVKTRPTLISFVKEMILFFIMWT